MQALLPLLSLFASPLGAMINKGLAVGAASIIAYGTGHGLPLDSTTNFVSAGVVFLSTLISGFAASQGVQIPRINADQTNGVKVVQVDAPAATVNKPLGPAYHGGPKG